MKHILINAKTAAQTVTIDLSKTATVVTKGLAGVESIAVNIETGTTFEALFESESAVVIDATSPQLILNGPGSYQFVKGVTAGAVTLQVTD